MSNLNEFYAYGCYSRCLIELSQKETIESFCEKYKDRFDDGMLGKPKTYQDAIEIAKDMGLPILSRTEEYNLARHNLNHGCKIIVMSKVNLSEGATDEINHASLLHKADEYKFTLWTTSQDGSSGLTRPFKSEEWKEKGCEAWVANSIGG